MQNKLISMTVMLLTSVVMTVNAQVVAPAPTAPVVQQEVKKEADVKKELGLPKEEVKSSAMPQLNEIRGEVKPVVPTIPEMPKVDKRAEFPALKPAPAKVENNQEVPHSPLGAVQKTPEEIRAENRRRMEEELKNTTTAGKSIVDFPNRLSLGSSELAPLPTINESIITGPAPMAQSVSSKDLPTEQLLGSITPAVFQEMADLERGNTFLKLQIEKEKMKNDLERLKSEYREKRLSEIAKREGVVRSRIQWWQEQEKIRLEIEKKEKEAEELAQKIAEQEANRERIRQEALDRMNAPKPENQPKVDNGEKIETVAEEPVEKPLQSVEELYTIESIRGVGRKLTAKLKTNADGTLIMVKRDDILPSGHVVRDIKKDAVIVMFGKHKDQLTFRPVTQ